MNYNILEFDKLVMDLELKIQHTKERNNLEKEILLPEIKKGNSDAMYKLGKLYNKDGDYDNMLKYYLMSIKKNNSFAMNSLAIYYKKQKDYDKMLIYYLMSIEQGNDLAVYNLGIYYLGIGELDESLKYFKIASKKGDIDATKEIVKYYKKDKNYKKILKYEFKLNNSEYIVTLNEYLCKNFDIDIAFQYMNDLSKKNLDELNKLIINYQKILKLKDESHISLILNKKEECCICFENNNSIHFKCKHFVCIDCYHKIKKCPMCRDSLI